MFYVVNHLRVITHNGFLFNQSRERSLVFYTFLLLYPSYCIFSDSGVRSCHYMFCSYVVVNSAVVFSWYYSNVAFLREHLGYLSTLVFLNLRAGHHGSACNLISFAPGQSYVLISISRTFCRNNQLFCLGLVILHICFVMLVIFNKVQLTACYPIILCNSLDGYKSVHNTILSCHVHSKFFYFYIVMRSFD